MFLYLMIRYFIMFRKGQIFEAIEHVDLYYFFRVHPFAAAYKFSSSPIRLCVFEALMDTAYGQSIKDIQTLSTEKLIRATLGTMGVNTLYESKFLQLMDIGDIETAVEELTLNFPDRSKAFRAAFLSATDETKTAVLRFLHEAMEENRFTWSAFFDTAEALALLDDAFTRTAMVTLQYEYLCCHKQATLAFQDVSLSRDARLPLLYKAMDALDDDSFLKALDAAQALLASESAAQRVTAGLVLRKYE